MAKYIRQQGKEYTVFEKDYSNKVDSLRRTTVDRSYLTNDPKWVNRKAVAPHIALGTVISGTINTLTSDGGVNWITNIWKDKVCKIYKNGEGSDFEFAIIESNTSNTLTFDDDLLFVPCELCHYDIIDTLIINETNYNSVISLNINEYNLGVVLPYVILANERKWFNIYIERSNNGDHIAPLICRKEQRMLGAKYGELIYNGEGVTLYSHSWESDIDLDGLGVRPHWDVLNLVGIQRLATGYWEAADTVPNTGVWEEVVSSINFDFYRRFRPVTIENVPDHVHIRYISLIERKFKATFTANIKKVGPGGELNISVGYFDPVTQQYVVNENRIATTTFGGADGVTSINVSVPITLKRNMEVIFYAKTTGTATFTIEPGSHVNIEQY